MPSSNYFLIPHICARIIGLRPASILDIGIGFGKYGFLAREYTDICQERYPTREWQTRIDGIEIFPDYVGDLQRLIYDSIYLGDAIDRLAQLGHYDLILLLDIIEHLEKKRALELLALSGKKSKVVLVSTPVKTWTKGLQYNNKYEQHISRWKRGELEKFGSVEVIAPDRKSIYLLEMKNG